MIALHRGSRGGSQSVSRAGQIPPTGQGARSRVGRWAGWASGLLLCAGLGLGAGGGAGAPAEAEALRVVAPPAGLGGSCEAPEPWVGADTQGPAGESVLGCLKRLGSQIDTRIPVDQRYDLTTFGGPGDLQPVDCGDTRGADGTWYYAANKQRFACGTKVRLLDLARERCVVVEVADTGPNICVEEASGRPTWDVSPLASRQLFGVGQAGWSEGRGILGAPVHSSNALGPCDGHSAMANQLGGAVVHAWTGRGQCGLAAAR